MRESLTLRAKEFNILVDDVAITHLSFGTEASTLLAHPGHATQQMLTRCTLCSSPRLWSPSRWLSRTLSAPASS